MGITTFQEVIELVEQLSEEERAQLRTYLDHQLPADQWIQRMEAAANAIRAGFTDEEWAAIEADINAEYVEPWDESEWRD